MIETVLGVVLVLLGLWVAPQGGRAYQGLFVLGVVLGFLSGLQMGSTAPLFAEPLGVPVLHGLFGAVVVGLLITVGLVLALGAVPFLIGAQIGRATFGHWLFGMATGTLLVGAVVLVVVVSLWVAVALGGGVLVSAGVQLLFDVVPNPQSYTVTAARRLPEPQGSSVVETTLSAIGAVTESPLLLGIAVAVAALGVLGFLGME